MTSVKFFVDFKFQWIASGHRGQGAAGHVGKDNKQEHKTPLHVMVVDNAVEGAPKPVIKGNVQVGSI